MNLFRKTVGHLDDSMQRSLSDSAHQLVAGGGIVFLGFPLSYIFWGYWFPQPYQDMGLCLIGSLLGLGLMLTPYWPAQLKVYLSWYWFLTILYAVPFFLGTMSQGRNS